MITRRDVRGGRILVSAIIEQVQVIRVDVFRKNRLVR